MSPSETSWRWRIPRPQAKVQKNFQRRWSHSSRSPLVCSLLPGPQAESWRQRSLSEIFLPVAFIAICMGKLQLQFYVNLTLHPKNPMLQIFSLLTTAFLTSVAATIFSFAQCICYMRHDDAPPPKSMAAMKKGRSLSFASYLSRSFDKSATTVAFIEECKWWAQLFIALSGNNSQRKDNIQCFSPFACLQYYLEWLFSFAACLVK